MDDDMESGLPLESTVPREDITENMDNVNTLEVRVFEVVTDLVADSNQHFNNGVVVDEQDTIRNMNWLSETLEQAETYFRQSPAASKRDGHLIGHLLRILDDFEVFYSMLERKLQPESAERANNEPLNAAVCRLLLATAPTNVRFIIRILYEEDVLDRVTGWANCEQSTTVAAMQLQCYASGLLSVGLRDRSIADIVVNHETFPINILKRARYYANVLESERTAATDYMLDIQKRNVNSKHKRQLATPGRKRKLSIEKEPPASRPSEEKQEAEIANQEGSDDANQPDLGVRLSKLLEGSEDFVSTLHEHEPRQLVLLDLLYTLDCVGLMGEYLELLAPALKEDIVGTSITFLHTNHVSVWSATLKLVSHFLAHKKFAFSFLEVGGLELVLKAHTTPKFSLLHRSLSMCLHGFASSSVVTELILSRETNRHAVLSLAFALLSSPHDRARQNAVVFFGLVVPFRSALEYFEAHDGIYTLFNLIRAGNSPKSAIQRQLAHDACLCLRQYVRVHFGIMTQGLRRKMDVDNKRPPKISPWKPVDIDDKAHEQHIALFEKHKPPPKESKWQSQFSHLRGPLVLLEVLDVFHSHAVDDQMNETTSYRLWLVERALFCLQVLRMLTLSYPPIALEICHTTLQESQRTGLTILLDCAMTNHPRDGDIVKGALQVFCNCVTFEKKPKEENKNMRAILKLAREKNAIKVCLQLLRYKRSLQQADSIRLLATQALLGLSKDRHMCQILEQMHIGQLLSDLIRNEPVLEENAEIHAKFRECALDLISHVTHRAPSAAIHEATDPTVRKIEKANIVAATRITYNPNELLLMIHDHLKANGLNQAAEALEKEAALNVPSTATLSPTKPKKTKSVGDSEEPAAKRQKTGDKPKLLSYRQRMQLMQNIWKQPSYFQKPQNESLLLSPKKTTSITKKPSKTTWLDTVVRQHLREQHRLCSQPVSVVPPFALSKSKPHRCPDVAPPPMYANVCNRLVARGIVGNSSDMHITRFVSSRHRPFRVVGHLDSQGGLTATRFMTSLDRHILLGTDHGEVVQVNMDSDEVVQLWSCHPNAGAISDVTTNELTRMAFSRSKPLLLTGTTRMTPYTETKVGLWDMGSMEDPKWSLTSMRSPRFNFNGDLVVAMASEGIGASETDSIRGTAIYDVETGTMISQLQDQSRNDGGNNYGDNSNCTFSPCDSTLLSDGLLWDVRSSKLLHKFDKLSNFGHGYYNPSGNEVIINSAVWDLRTFKLLRIIPALETCKIQFSSTRPAMYVYSPFEPMVSKDAPRKLPKQRTWFRVLDTRDYKDISTVDIERPIYDMSLNAQETVLSIVEGRYLDSVYGQDSPVCRLYEVGRDKPNECDSDLEDTVEESDSMDDEDGFGESNSSVGEESESGSYDTEDEFDTDTDYDEEETGDSESGSPISVQWALPDQLGPLVVEGDLPEQGFLTLHGEYDEDEDEDDDDE
ncbi:hypothetical protein LEN26_005731 [Aphanomyces euteiches]|nr:hypothetical protein AeMF1_001125 [Aphanomyces euteiches]KAH9137438.1 hypothetical protein LEN26_005731 [Aphanomyces euteiches]